MSTTQNVDWEAAANSPEFKELDDPKRRFVLPATVFFLPGTSASSSSPGTRRTSWARRSIEGVTVGYIFALSQFVMVWVLAAVYLRRADKVFDPLAEKAAEKAIEAGAAQHAAAQPRATPPPHGRLDHRRRR